LSSGEGEEADNHDRPNTEEQAGLLFRREPLAPLSDLPGHLLQALRQENHPGRQPQYGECPKDEKRDGIVSRRNSLAQISKELLVNKIKPQEALDGSRAAHLGWIANRRKNVPGRSNRQKHQSARDQPQLQNVPEIFRDQKVDKNLRHILKLRLISS